MSQLDPMTLARRQVDVKRRVIGVNDDQLAFVYTDLIARAHCIYMVDGARIYGHRTTPSISQTRVSGRV